MRPRRWLRTLFTTAAHINPFGGLSAAAPGAITFLPYQLEPALALLRHRHTRVLIADAVGLGKTIQAGLILRQLGTERESFRGLVVVPAGLRDQWNAELGSRFGIRATIATSSWLARTAAQLPADVNPWSLPGTYLASFDFIKRPEARQALEEVIWDAMVVDEAHHATPGSARHAAVHALALRARRVILLSATPHGGDPEQFRALCSLGSPEGNSPPLLIFRRSRADVGTAGGRRTVMLPVRLSDAELRMHRVLDAYTARVCAESRRRGQVQGRLAAIVLAKRALSSAASLAVSCRRRLELLTDRYPPVAERQLQLPLGEEDPLDDEEPAAILAAPGLTDTEQEQRWLTAIIEAADHAARAESKLRLLRRLFRRANEPAIVFTEYRDTLERIRLFLTGLGPPVTVLHGGLSAAERAEAQREFNASDSVMLATDAAAEGLNLHHRCRLVIHFELPWNPSRLEQRTGRVDRIGQTRIVHETILVANDTAERRILAPLARRAARARQALPRQSQFFDVLTEARVAAAVMDAIPIQLTSADVQENWVSASTDLQKEARDEAIRLDELRKWIARAGKHPVPSGIAATWLGATRGGIADGVICVYTLALTTADGNLRHAELAIVRDGWRPPAVPETPAELRRVVSAFRHARGTAIEGMLANRLADRVKDVNTCCAAATACAAEREETVVGVSRGLAEHLVQASLFGHQRGPLQPSQGQIVRLEDAGHYREQLASASQLTPTLELRAILIVAHRRRT
jgi:superfamily II DNA or RNA helicase